VKGLEPALRELRAGRPIVLPTETVYGIAASPTRAAIDLLFALKGRPTTKAIPVLGRDVDALAEVVVFDRAAKRLAERFWPGPLTLVLPRAATFDVYLGEGEPGVAVRVPDDPIAGEVLGAAGILAVTSANRSGEAPARAIEEAKAAFGDDVHVYLDGGPRAGRPSTLLSLVGSPHVLREGPVATEDVLDCIEG
jgi:L-threonylcarbamoyladenylate synthase